MDASELLKSWPGWAKANAARVLASPAWRFETQYDGKAAVLTRGAAMPSAAISLSVKLNDIAKVVTFAPSPLFPDLWLLRERLDKLPSEVLLALVEKEGGPLFQFFEDFCRQSFSIEGLSDHPATCDAFLLTAEGGELCFALELAPEVELSLGQLSNLDVKHESIRSLTRDVTACHAVIEMTDEEVASLQVGDCLMLPEPSQSGWLLEIPSDNHVRAITSEPRQVTFAELADETLGPVPVAETVQILRGNRPLATGVLTQLGEAKAIKIHNLG